MQNVLKSLLREIGIEVESESEQRASSRGRVEGQAAVRLRRGIPYTPQVFTPEEGGVPPRP